MATKKGYILILNFVYCGDLSSATAYTTEEETGQVVIYEGPKRSRRLTAYKYLERGRVFPAQGMKGYREIKRMAPFILKLGARWMWSASRPGSFTSSK